MSTLTGHWVEEEPSIITTYYVLFFPDCIQRFWIGMPKLISVVQYTQQGDSNSNRGLTRYKRSYDKRDSDLE